jgi:uncharacterized protein (DUF362 family)/NAD-dependent dihydropyrimidine dehydrogenase PreA subunit
MKMTDLVVRPCPDYSTEGAYKALEEVLKPLGGLDWVTKGMKVAIKANLVGPFKPESAAVTHPALLAALTKLLRQKGAIVTVGDSPGGIYNKVYLDRVYAASGMKAVEAAGGSLNNDFSTAQADFPEAKVLKHFEYTAWLNKADAIIDFCKLKVHGMMGMSAAVKNLFGAIPGTVKLEYHYKYPDYNDFANMLVDLNEYFKPRLSIADAVVTMEGNGPTAGTPRHMGVLLASNSPYKLDLGCAALINLDRSKIPYMEAAYQRGLMPSDCSQLNIDGDLKTYVAKDFKNVAVRRDIALLLGDNVFTRILSKTAGALLRSTPMLDKGLCVGCAACAGLCPAKAITMINKKAVIDRKSCITCFCCQEFCPKGAMKVHRPLAAKLIGRL